MSQVVFHLEFWLCVVENAIKCYSNKFVCLCDEGYRLVLLRCLELKLNEGNG